MFHKHSDSQRVLFINTLLQRGVLRGAETQNRFNGFYALWNTAEAVRTLPAHLKQGVNDKMRSDNHLVCEMFRLESRVVDQPGLANKYCQRHMRATHNFGYRLQSHWLEKLDVIHLRGGLAVNKFSKYVL